MSHRSDWSRRDVLKAGAACAPMVASNAGLRWLPGGDDRTLIAIELVGGNDGLNTLIPIEDPAWGRARKSLSNVRNGSHRIADGWALHPSMPEIADLFERGEAAGVHGVGYTPPNRSHFRSRDIWQSADPQLQRVTAKTTGWLGRAAEQLAERGAAVPALSVGSLDVPLALRSEKVVVPSLRRIEDYELLVTGSRKDAGRRDLKRLVRDSAGSAEDDDLLQFLGGVSNAALDGEARMRDALRRYRPKADYPENELGRTLQITARVVASGFGTRLFWLSLGGFDTHANQAPSHAGLLRTLSSAIGAFVQDLRGHGRLEQTAIVVYSEFGRRVAENQSQGTDHGAAGPVFLFGGGAKSGLHGESPSLTRLVDGDLRATCDFRSIYQNALTWLGADPEPILGGKMKPITVLP